MPTLRRPRALWSWLALAIGAGCGSETELDLATPPDLAPLADLYERPTGSIELPDIACLGQSVLDEIEARGLQRVRDLLVESLDSLRQRLQASGLPTWTTGTDPDGPKVRGQVHLERICQGWDPQVTTPDAAQNGQIDLVAQVENSLLNAIWGRATACRGRFDGDRGLSANLYLDATLAIHLYSSGLSDAQVSTFLVQLSGELGTELKRASVELDFRVTPSSLDLRIGLESGDIIASVHDGRVELQTRNGSYVYDPATATPTTCAEGTARALRSPPSGAARW